MLASLIIVFREVLEAALIVGIIMAATRGVRWRNRWIASGIAGGLFGALIVAGFARVIGHAAEGMGMELFNATILGLAVLMLGWHNVWMATHGREMAKEASHIGHQVQHGDRPLYALAVVVGVAVLREGAETVLFLYGIVAGSDQSSFSLTLGGLLGVVAGVAVGVTLYKGLLRIPLKHIFSVSGALILLLACGLASQCAGLLEQADKLPSLGSAIWDSSAFLSESSLFGKVLHTMIGYVARPDGIQLVAYGATFIVIAGLKALVTRRHQAQPATA